MKKSPRLLFKKDGVVTFLFYFFLRQLWLNLSNFYRVDYLTIYQTDYYLDFLVDFLVDNQDDNDYNDDNKVDKGL